MEALLFERGLADSGFVRNYLGYFVYVKTGGQTRWSDEWINERRFHEKLMQDLFKQDREFL